MKKRSIIYFNRKKHCSSTLSNVKKVFSFSVSLDDPLTESEKLFLDAIKESRVIHTVHTQYGVATYNAEWIMLFNSDQLN